MSAENERLWEMRVAGLAVDPAGGSPVVVLRDVDEEHQVPIWIGQMEAIAIASELEGIRHPRPMTHDLLRDVFTTLEAPVVRVVINDLRDNTFYAQIVVQRGSAEVTVDSRPSDAIALALRADAPIFAADHVVQQARMDPPSREDDDEEDDAGARATDEADEAPGGRALVFQGPAPASDEEWEELLKELDPQAFGKYKQ